MAQGLYDFWQKELADYYLESIKPVMSGDNAEAKKAALNTLYICLDFSLKMLHPSMPYLTEELYQRLPHRKGEAFESICIATFPETLASFEKENVEDHVAQLQLVVTKCRSQMAALNIGTKDKPTIYIRCEEESVKKIFALETAVFQSNIKAGDTSILAKGDAEPEGCIKSFVTDKIQFYIKVVGLIDIKLEIDRVNKANAKLLDLKEKLGKKMSIKGYEEKVPEKTKLENQAKSDGYQKEIDANEKSIKDLQKFL